MEKKVLLSAKNVSKSFANEGKQNHVINSLSVDIYEKDFTVIMGSSGSGKSTLLYCLSGMDKVTSGEVFFKGKKISDVSENKLSVLRRSEFGFVFQQMHLVSNLSIFENVAVPGYQSSKSAKEIDKRANEFLKQVGLSGDVVKRLPSQCSGGEQQRGAVARALINEPSLLFADEPTGALNKKSGTDILNLLTFIHQQNQSILMVTHDVRAAMRATRILYIEDGAITGELNLTNYHDQMDKIAIQSRETQINAWLSSLQW